MKTKFSIGTASLAIAISMSSAAHAREANATITLEMPELDTEVVMSAEEPDRWLNTSAQLNAIASATNAAAIAFDPVVVDLPQLAAPVAIEPNIQQAIYDVDFLQDAGEGLVTLPTAPAYEPIEADVSVGISPTEINQDIQQAIFDVNFIEGGEGIITLDGLEADPLSSATVTARSLQSYNVDAYYGDIDAFYGDIDAFWGDINPFYGDIGAFYGDIDAFWGDISPFYGDITAFWGDIDAFWGDIVAFDAAHLQSLGNYGNLLSRRITELNGYWDVEVLDGNALAGVQTVLNRMKIEAIEQFGSAGFNESEAEKIYARHGMTFGDYSTYALSPTQRAAFLLDWHDTVNTFSGIDAVDHWMGTINWTPGITQIQGDGADTLIGIIDSNFYTSNVVKRYWFADGANTDLGGHGAGVASLIAGAHDGEGVMGIAPNANIFAFNPFDAGGQTTWSRISTSLYYAGLYNRYNDKLGITQDVSVINMSLGEAGWVASQGLADVLAEERLVQHLNDSIYVIAAGNDGVAQTQDIEWGYFDSNSHLFSLTNSSEDLTSLEVERVSGSTAIFVGSVRPDGTISSFSNTPGDACLLDNGVCNAGNELMNRFIVAPGELILVSDGNGGVVRRSGTSFAAPLVSGAIALLHDRWPWLQNHAADTADIILRSARDLGAPGVDAVYGHGLLDVAASQSPLDFGALSFTVYQRKGKNYRSNLTSASSLLAEGSIPSSWETNDAFLTAFEPVGATYRDFAIPLSSLQRGNTTDALGNGVQRMQDFVEDRFARWLLSNGADKDGDGKLGVSQVRSNAGETSGQWKFSYDAMPPRFTQDGAVRPVHNSASLTTPDGKASFTLGHGQGALSLAGGEFGIASDHDHHTGGVNPVLGIASGEVFAGASYNIASDTKVSVGFSAEREDWNDLDFGNDLDRQIQRQLGAREAQALTVAVDQNVTDNLTFGVQFTHLDEADAVLGAQTGSDALLGEGSRTDAMTVSANFDAGSGLSFDLSVTGGATATNEGQLLATNGRAFSSAGQFAVNKRGVMNSRDILRVSVGQPLTVESGELELRSDQVIDRQTGEIGTVSQFIGIDTKRRFTSELVYATPVSDDAEFGLMGRYVSAGEIGQEESFMIGANFGLRF